jgi:RNA polymerase sigma-70 factor, ECF subfamily
MWESYRSKLIHMTEEKIIQLLHDQHHEVVGYLYDNYGAALFGVALRIVRSRELAEQVLQDSFVKIWKNGSSYDRSKGRLFTWMLNIARNTAIDATRTNYYQFYSKTDEVTALYSTESSDRINPDHIGIRQIVDSLDEKYRVLIEKIYFEGYTQQEVEEEMGIPIGTVKTRLRSAIQQLRSQFGGTEVLALVLFLEKITEQ